MRVGGWRKPQLHGAWLDPRMPDDWRWEDSVIWYGERVARRRAAAGMSQTAFASWVGVSQSTMSRIECGQLRGTRLEVIARIEHELALRRV